MNSDFKDLLRVFNDGKVRYLVVGGYAVIKYTEPRYTKDLDVWVEASPRNAKAVFAALRKFGAPLVKITAADFAKEGCVYQMGRPPARVDVVTSIDGVQFAAAWLTRVASDFDGVPAPVISREHLLINKRAVGRPQDLVDLNILLQAESPPGGSKRDVKPKKRNPKRK
jgi:hypothetical protein